MNEVSTEAESNAVPTDDQLIAYLPALLYTGNRFERGLGIVCDHTGRITEISREVGRIPNAIRLPDQAILPGMTNAHSHAFQRVIRGRTETRTGNAVGDNFWTWRTAMYTAANLLSPEDIYDASRMAFLEMALGGITSVGEFHYIHRASEGAAYDDPNLLAKEVVRAAREVGIRIGLLRTAYARSGFRKPLDYNQRRFIEPEPDIFIGNAEALRRYLLREEAEGTAWLGVAPHSVRAVPLDYLREVFAYADEHELPVHMHVAEQPAEVDACIAEHGRAPVALLDFEGLLSKRFTGVHAIHISGAEARAFSDASATVCACPTTERNLGDGIVMADLLLGHRNNVSIALGTDRHAQIDLLEDARELEYHLRLQKLERAVLPAHIEAWHFPQEMKRSPDVDLNGLARTLFACATTSGARSIGAPGGDLEVGSPADFFSVALNDVSVAGAGEEDLLASIVFSSSRAAVRTVVVGGVAIVQDGMHPAQEEIVARFCKLQNKLWRNA
ncbi:MAG: formimidoylglutamate deiminase [Pyrinomonadaceae bacterium]|nr:formimidoylglutamate deiminase [Pyrinomonadaceae bacterium]